MMGAAVLCLVEQQGGLGMVGFVVRRLLHPGGNLARRLLAAAVLPPDKRQEEDGPWNPDPSEPENSLG